MKKNPTGILSLLLLLTLLLSGCAEAEPEPTACPHVWQEATCTAPKTCEICGETEDAPLPHDVVYTAMYARSYEGFCRVCSAALTDTITEEAWEAIAQEAHLGKWYCALMHANNTWNYIRYNNDDTEVSASFNSDGTARIILGKAYDQVGTWKFSNLHSTANGTMVFIYYVTMPDDTYTFSIQAFAEDNFGDFDQVTVPPGFTLLSSSDGTQMPRMLFTRERQGLK